MRLAFPSLDLLLLLLYKTFRLSMRKITCVAISPRMIHISMGGDSADISHSRIFNITYDWIPPICLHSVMAQRGQPRSRRETPLIISSVASEVNSANVWTSIFEDKLSPIGNKRSMPPVGNARHLFRSGMHVSTTGIACREASRISILGLPTHSLFPTPRTIY